MYNVPAANGETQSQVSNAAFRRSVATSPLLAHSPCVNGELQT